MSQVDVLWIVAMMVIATGIMWTQRRKMAKTEVDRLVARGGLPPERDLVESALKWYERRQAVLLLGLLAGTLAGGAIVVLAYVGMDIGFETGAVIDVRLLTWMVAAASAAGGIATLGLSYRTVRASRIDGPRMAALRPRRLSDYLSPIEIAIHYGSLVLPLVAVGLGIVVLGSNDKPVRGWILIGSGLAAVPLWAVGAALQRMALRVNQPSGRQAELHWQEALRATTLRDLGSSMITVSWLLGASIPMSFQWPADAPAFAEPLSEVLFLVAVGLMCVMWGVAASRRGLQRVQRVVG
ncbi:hypothetical protein AB0L70_38435 [Kribbella sp. NPDC051952]|uniref:hypothetical protein n=1 Tax=Kribbella sp. NPDC051952 TaxID=3154851 RepID=UPI003435E84C